MSSLFRSRVPLASLLKTWIEEAPIVTDLDDLPTPIAYTFNKDVFFTGSVSLVMPQDRK